MPDAGTNASSGKRPRCYISRLERRCCRQNNPFIRRFDLCRQCPIIPHFVDITPSTLLHRRPTSLTRPLRDCLFHPPEPRSPRSMARSTRYILPRNRRRSSLVYSVRTFFSPISSRASTSHRRNQPQKERPENMAVDAWGRIGGYIV